MNKKPETPNLSLVRPDLRHEWSDLRLEKLYLRPMGGTNKLTKVPMRSTGLCPRQGHCPKSRKVPQGIK